MEEQLAKYYRPEDQKLKEYEHPHTHTLALQRELDSTRERYKKQITQLESQVENLLKELQKMHSKESGRFPIYLYQLAPPMLRLLSSLTLHIGICVICFVKS